MDVSKTVKNCEGIIKIPGNIKKKNTAKSVREALPKTIPYFHSGECKLQPTGKNVFLYTTVKKSNFTLFWSKSVITPTKSKKKT